MIQRLHHTRRGFLFTMPLMLGIGMIIFASMIAISQLFVAVGGPLVPDLIADMPTIFQYTDTGQRIPQYMPLFTSENHTIIITDDTALTEQQFSEKFPSLAMYGLMVKIAIGIFVILLMLAGLSYFFEEFNIVRQGTAYNIIAKMIILVPIFLVLPYLWDMVALVIESSALYLIDPFGGNPEQRTAELWCMMGSVTCSINGMSVEPLSLFENISDYNRNQTLSQDSWNQVLQQPIFGEDIIVNVLLSLFKGFSIMFMTAMMFVLSAIRVVLTEVIIISFPLVMAIGLIPWINTKRISDMFQQNLIGLAMAPIMSAIVLSIGMATIESQNMPPLRMWFQLLSVGFLAIFFPVLLSPMLGNLSGKVGQMISTAVTSASTAGSIGLKGAIGGISQSTNAMSAAGVGAAAGASGKFTSANMGSVSSGIHPSNFSTFDKAKIYGKAGMIGMLSGIGSGLVQSTTQSIGMGAAAQGVSNQMMHTGDGKIDGIVHNAITGNTQNNIESQIRTIESSNTPVNINNQTIMNPGEKLNSMTNDANSFDAGQKLLHNPQMRDEFADAYGKNIGLEDRSPEIQEKFRTQISSQIDHHPSAAAKIFERIKSK